MTDKEKIRAEIIRRIEEEQRIRREKEKLTGVGSIIDTRYESLLSFIDSMQEKPVSDKLGGINNALIQDRCVQEYPVCDDLEKEIGEFISASIVGIQYCRHAIVEWGKRVARHFADWQKQQMMANAVDVTIAIPYQNSEGGYTQLVDSKKGLPFGDNVKVLVIRED